MRGLGRLRIASLAAIVLVAAAVATLSVRPDGAHRSDAPAASQDPWLTDAAIETATAFRLAWGLEAEPAVVRSVAANPSARLNAPELGVPLTSDELRGLLRRPRDLGRVQTVIVAYGKDHPEAWGGLRVADGEVTVLLADDDGRHERQLRRRVSPHVRLRFEAAPWSLAEVQALREFIPRDPWFQQRFRLFSLGVNAERNVVELTVSSADPAVITTITSHYGADRLLDVTIDGTGVLALPNGDLAGQVFDRATGLPAPGLTLDLEGDIPGAGGQGDVGTGTDVQGRFRFRDVEATGYEVLVYRDCDADGRHLEWPNHVLLGSSRAVVVAGQTTRLRIEVDWPGCPF